MPPASAYKKGKRASVAFARKAKAKKKRVAKREAKNAEKKARHVAKVAKSLKLVEAVVVKLKAQPGVAKVAEWACLKLWIIACTNTGAEACIAAGAVAAIATLNAHPGVMRAAEEAYDALESITITDGETDAGKMACIEARAVAAIEAKLKAHPDVATVAKRISVLQLFTRSELGEEACTVLEAAGGQPCTALEDAGGQPMTGSLAGFKRKR